MQSEAYNGSLQKIQNLYHQDEPSMNNNYIHHLSKMSNYSQNSQLIESIGAIMYFINQEKEFCHKIGPPQSIKYQEGGKDRQQNKQLMANVHNDKQYKLSYRNHLKLSHQQTALILTNSRKEQISSQILNKILLLKLRSLESQQFNNQSVQLQLSKDQQQLSQLCLQQQENQCLKYKYWSQKYKYLCRINKQILQESRQAKAHQQ